MAKNYKDFDDSDGVWRTIGGRRVFIKDGQSLSDAMKESGKFSLSKKQKEAGDRLNERAKKDAENDIKEYLSGNKDNWDDDGDFIRDLANEYGLETEEAKKMFNNAKRTDLETKYQKYVNEKLNDDDYLRANRPNEYFQKQMRESGVKTFADEIKEQGKKSNEKFSVDYFKKQGVEIKDEAPEGWVKLEGATTAPNGYEWYSNGKSRFGGEYKNALVKKNGIETISKENYDKMPKDYKGSLKELVNTAEFRGENKEELAKKYKDMGYDIENDKTILKRTEKGTTLTPVKVKGDSNVIPRDFEKGYGKFKVKTNANDSLDDRFEITKDENGFHAKNLRTEETYATFGEHLRNNNVFEFENTNNNQINNTIRQKAYQKYLKEHPSSKMTFEDFKDMRKQ